jgi:hypothetical protein
VTRNGQLRSGATHGDVPSERVHAIESRADHANVNSDLRRIVECLHSAHYTDGEIVDYLEHFFGLTADEAHGAVLDAAGNAGRTD